MASTTTHHLLPPFAEDIKTAPLVSVSFAKLEAGDSEASDALFKACRNLGFFYLDLFGSELGEMIVSEAEELNALQKEFFKMPYDVKDKYGRPHLHPFYAYRYNDLDAKDESGVTLRAESYNVSGRFPGLAQTFERQPARSGFALLHLVAVYPVAVVVSFARAISTLC